MKYRQNRAALALALTLMTGLLAGCGEAAASAPAQSESAPVSSQAAVADSSEMVTPESVVEENMVPVPGSSVRDGVYSVTVDSSSSMFNITSCELTAQDGELTARMTMGGKGYKMVYMGTGEQAAAAPEQDCIPFEELPTGEHVFTVPVEALDAGIDCAAFSKKKEKWYDRTLVFRADSLPLEAFAADVVTDAAALGLEDGSYTAEVSLSGGSGKASVQSPAALTVEEGRITATVIWGSSNYDYMLVDGEKYEPVTLEGGSTFVIPVRAFDWALAVTADTVAMSQPHEIDYTLTFDSASLVPAP